MSGPGKCDTEKIECYVFQIAFDRSIWCLFFEYLMEIFVLLLFSSVFVVCFVVWMWFDAVSCLCEKISSLPCCVLSWTSFLFFRSGVLMNRVFSINVNFYFTFFCQFLLVQSQQWKPQNNVWNLYKVTIKSTRTTSLTLLWFFYDQLWTGFTNCSGVSIVTFEQVKAVLLCCALYTTVLLMFYFI